MYNPIRYVTQHEKMTAEIDQLRADLAASQREVERLRAECLTAHDAGRAFEHERVIAPFIAEQDRTLGVLAAANDKLRAEVERCRGLLSEMVANACTAGGILDSMGLAANADALRYLAEIGRVEIVSEQGRRVVARWKP